MSHDLRTPMNAIIGHTRILLCRSKDALDERSFRNLDNIRVSADNLLILINDILDLSRIEAGRVDISPEDVDLGQLVRDCVTSVRPLVKSDVELLKRVDEAKVNTDSVRLRRVVMNLLSNAVKFTDQGSITVSLRQDGDGVELAVADTGHGIPAEDLPHIFDEFRQVDRDGAEKEGTGLGLSIARKSVELLGGTLTAVSEVGVGTTFTVRIGDYPEPMT
ncbi:MAG: HAMP domain-containing sensor histidine kinase [Candidatus Latescibacterota bacterium]